VKEGAVPADRYGFLTTAPNAKVGALHPKAMPVTLTTAEAVDL
jgi:putative SOS response-associated peptidase YedK